MTHPQSTADAPPARRWGAVTGEVMAGKVNRIVFAATAVVVGFGYSVLLPFGFTQRVSLANWRYLDARYLGFTVAFALGMACVLTLQVHAMRRVARNAGAASGPRQPGPLGAIAAVISLLPSLLCCSPIVPALVGLLGLSATTRLRATGRITYFFATREDLLLLGALGLLVASVAWSMRKLSRAACLADEACAPASSASR
jgi:hypothetical protein